MRSGCVGDTVSFLETHPTFLKRADVEDAGGEE